MGTDRGQPYLCTVINYSSLTLKDVANKDIATQIVNVNIKNSYG